MQSGDENMSRTDEDFKTYVCSSLRDLADKHSTLESQMKGHIEMTQEMVDIIKMGKSMFQFAGYVGAAMRWVGWVGGGIAVLWAIFSGHFKDILK